MYCSVHRTVVNPRSYCGVIYLDKKYCRLAELVFGQVNDLRHCRNDTMPYLTVQCFMCIPTPNNQKRQKQTRKAQDVNNSRYLLLSESQVTEIARRTI